MNITFRDKHQKQLYSKIREFIDSENNTLLVSGPPGSGKTFITISSLLDNFDGKIAVILRTHSQQDHYAKLFGNEFLSIRGIEFHCKIPQVKMHPLRNQLCRWMRLGRHTVCQGCQYRVQFLEIPKHKIISFLYSHSTELIQGILENLKENYIIVFDEYHHCLPKEQTFSIHFLQLASAEYGSSIDLNNADIVNKIPEMKNIGEKNWRRIGYSYLLSLAEIIQYLAERNRWFYKADNDYCYLDDSVYSLIKNTSNAKKIFISATPLPEIDGLLAYDDKFDMNYELKNTVFLLYTGFKFNFQTRRDDKVVKHIRKLLHHLAKYKTVIFFPSKSALKAVYPRLPENFTTNPSEFPEKNTLLISGGKYSEGIDLPRDLEIIAVIGIPYDDPVYRNPYLRELFRYFKMYDIKVRKLLYDYRALLKVIQSIGRGIRDPKQKLIAILADKRYMDERWLEIFPEWLKANISRFRGISDIKLLDEFITRYFLGLNDLSWIDQKYQNKIFGIE